MNRKPSPGEPDEAIIIREPTAEAESRNQLQQSTFVIAALLLSPSIGFCWWLMLVSFIVAYRYALFVARSCKRPPECGLLSTETIGFALTTGFQLVLLAGVALWCLSLTPAHLFMPTAADLWMPYAIHDPLRMTQTMYDPGEAATVDIFAIHGLGSGPDSAWTHKSNGTQVRWLSDLLPKSAGLESARIIMVNHQTRWDSNSANMDLAGHASELLGNIERHHKANPERPVIFVSHSFGGLLLKKALLLAKAHSRDIAAMTRGIIFLGVPHRGTNAAYAAICLSCMAFFRGSSSHLLQFMAVDSPGILDLESEFYDAYVVPDYSQQVQVQPYICDVLETRPERMGKLALGSIVRPKHGLLRHGRIFTLDTDHRGLNKFPSQDDPNFQILSRILSQAVAHALGGDAPSEPSTGDPSILEYALYGMHWTTTSATGAAVIGALHEFVSSYLARDRNKYGGYLTSRVYKTALYASLVELPINHALSSALFKVSEGWNSLGYRLLQLSVRNLTIVPVLATVYLSATAYIAGARTFHQHRATVAVGFRRLITISWIVSIICIVVADRVLVPAVWPWFLNTGLLVVHTYVNAYIKKKRLAALRRKYYGSSKRKPAASDDGSGKEEGDVEGEQQEEQEEQEERGEQEEREEQDEWEDVEGEEQEEQQEQEEQG